MVGVAGAAGAAAWLLAAAAAALAGGSTPARCSASALAAEQTCRDGRWMSVALRARRSDGRRVPARRDRRRPTTVDRRRPPQINALLRALALCREVKLPALEKPALRLLAMHADTEECEQRLPELSPGQRSEVWSIFRRL